MKRTDVILAVILTAVFICHMAPLRARGETKAMEMRKRDRRHVAIMSYGTYSSPMSSDRKTIIVTDDGRVVLEEIYAPNREFYAQTDPAACVTTVFGVVRHGSLGRRVDRWSMPLCLELLGLSGDGNRLVLGRMSEDRAIRGSDPEEVALTFVDRGEMVREIRLGEIAPSAPEALINDTTAAWGSYRRLNAAGYYIVETNNKTPIVFDTKTGDRLDVQFEETGDIEGWLRYIDVYNWFELQYPDDCTIKAGEDIEGYPTGSIRFECGNTGWTATAAIERITDYGADEDGVSAFVEFSIERAKVMNLSDGPTSSTYADSIISQTLYINSQDIEVLELLLSMVHVEWTDEEEIVERNTRGPIYAALLSPEKDEPRRVLFLSPAHGLDPQPEDIHLLREIADTIGYPE